MLQRQEDKRNYIREGGRLKRGSPRKVNMLQWLRAQKGKENYLVPTTDYASRTAYGQSEWAYSVPNRRSCESRSPNSKAELLVLSPP